MRNRLTGFMKTGLACMVAIAMTLTMFPLIAGGGAYAATYDADDGLTVQIDGSRLTVEVLAQELDVDDDGEFEYYLNFDANGESSAPEWATAANQDAVTTIFIGEGTYTLGTYSFLNFDEVNTVYIPESIYRIKKDAFAGCDAVKTIYFGGTQSRWNTIVNERIEEGNDALTASSVEVICGEGYKDIKNAKVTLSKTKYVYQGSNESFRPNAKVAWGSKTLTRSYDYALDYSDRVSVGKAYVTVGGYNEYKGAKKVAFKIIPKKTSIKTVIRPAKKKLKVTWKKQPTKMATSHITGYQIWIARNSAFTKDKHSYKIKGYKNTTKTIKVKYSKKKYYIKIRTYKVVNGDTYYSNWSKVKTKIAR